MSHTLCESRDCARHTAAGFSLCAECRQAVRRDLRGLPALYRDCEVRLASTPQGIVQRISRTKPLGISLNEAAMRARSDILDILSSWCTLVVDERRVTGPGARTAPCLAAFLDRNLHWLARHAAAGDFATEVHELARRRTRRSRSQTRELAATRPLRQAGLRAHRPR